MNELDAISYSILSVSTSVSILGLAGNIFGAVILTKMEKKKIGGVRLLRYLAYADIIILLFNVVTLVLDMWVCVQNKYITVVILHLNRIIYTFEVYLTVLIAFQRCLALALPFKVATYLTDQRVNKILVGTGVLALVLPMPACVMVYARIPSTTIQNASLEVTASPAQSSDHLWSYRHYILATFYVYIPIVTLTVCNIALVVFRCRMTSEIRRSATRGPGQLTAVVLTMTAMSVATHTSNIIYIDLCASGIDPVVDITDCLPKLISNLCLYVNCSTNIIFYCCFGQAFRRCLRELVCKKCVANSKTDEGDSEVTSVVTKCSSDGDIIESITARVPVLNMHQSNMSAKAAIALE